MCRISKEYANELVEKYELAPNTLSKADFSAMVEQAKQTPQCYPANESLVEMVFRIGRKAGVFTVLLFALVGAIHAADKPKVTPDPNAIVWLNTDSNVYHCEGTRWFKASKHGELTTQANAKAKGARPSRGKECGFTKEAK